MTHHMYTGEANGFALLLVALLGLSLRLTLEKTLLQHQCILNILLALSGKTLIESWYAVSLPSTVTFNSSP